MNTPTQFASYSIPSRMNPGYARPCVETPAAIYSGPELLPRAIPAFTQLLQRIANGGAGEKYDIGILDGKQHYRVPASI